VFNLLSHAVVNHISWHVFRPVVKEVWGGEIDVSYGNPYHNVIREGQLILCAYSPTVLPKPPDVPENVRVTGYWFLKPPPHWEPDPGLISFLASGPTPIYVGFGSMGNPAKNRDTTDTILRALAETGCRAVLAAGWSGLGAGQRLSDNVFLLKSIPHSWLFARMSAIVHHGGSGTTGAALASGMPNVVIPHFGDQFFWGRRIAELGAGPEPIARDDLAAEKLSRAISTALHDRDMREKAGMIGSQIRAEDGIDTAVRAIRELLGW
jgi:UDP:flavonoid glycosyltransferase YjiC (YdhE family)